MAYKVHLQTRYPYNGEALQIHIPEEIIDYYHRDYRNLCIYQGGVKLPATPIGNGDYLIMPQPWGNAIDLEISPGSPSYNSLWDGLVTANTFRHQNFEDGTGQNPAVPTGTVSWYASASRGYMLNLTGNGVYVAYDNAEAFENTSFSMSFWYYVIKDNFSVGYTSSNDTNFGYRIKKYGPNNSIQGYAGAFFYSGTIDEGNFGHLVFTRDGTTDRIYINGTQSASRASATLTGLGNGTYKIGTYWNGGAWIYEGCKLCDHFVYNRALSAQEVEWLYDSTIKWATFPEQKENVFYPYSWEHVPKNFYLLLPRGTPFFLSAGLLASLREPGGKTLPGTTSIVYSEEKKTQAESYLRGENTERAGENSNVRVFEEIILPETAGIHREETKAHPTLAPARDASVEKNPAAVSNVHAQSEAVQTKADIRATAESFFQATELVEAFSQTQTPSSAKTWWSYHIPAKTSAAIWDGLTRAVPGAGQIRANKSGSSSAAEHVRALETSILPPKASSAHHEQIPASTLGQAVSEIFNRSPFETRVYQGSVLGRIQTENLILANEAQAAAEMAQIKHNDEKNWAAYAPVWTARSFWAPILAQSVWQRASQAPTLPRVFSDASRRASTTGLTRATVENHFPMHGEIKALFQTLAGSLAQTRGEVEIPVGTFPAIWHDLLQAVAILGETRQTETNGFQVLAKEVDALTMPAQSFAGVLENAEILSPSLASARDTMKTNRPGEAAVFAVCQIPAPSGASVWHALDQFSPTNASSRWEATARAISRAMVRGFLQQSFPASNQIHAHSSQNVTLLGATWDAWENKLGQDSQVWHSNPGIYSAQAVITERVMAILDTFIEHINTARSLDLGETAVLRFFTKSYSEESASWALVEPESVSVVVEHGDGSFREVATAILESAGTYRVRVFVDPAEFSEGQTVYVRFSWMKGALEKCFREKLRVGD